MTEMDLQGVIGDTFYGKPKTAATTQAATMDNPAHLILPPHLAYMMYPVFPDSAYKLKHLFDRPALPAHLTPDFMQSLIDRRRAIARSIVAAFYRKAQMEAANDPSPEEKPNANSTASKMQ